MSVIKMTDLDLAGKRVFIRADLNVPVKEEPVGTVWFAFATARGEGITRRECFSGDRDAVRRQATAYALQTLWQQFLQNT